MDMKDYYLDLDKMKKSSLTNEEKDRIHSMYMDILHSLGNSSMENFRTSLINTLIKGGYLKSMRDEKLDDILKS